MSHYEVLGVATDVSDDELRRAYLRLARRFHPDRFVGRDAADAADAESRMRQINAAWQVLGSPASRAAYDATLGLGGASPGPAVTKSKVDVPSASFRPYFDRDEDDDDSWRYEPDQGDPATAPPRLLLIAPPVLLAASAVLLVAGFASEGQTLVAVAMIGLFFAALLFVGAPLVTLLRSRSAEERAARRR